MSFKDFPLITLLSFYSAPRLHLPVGYHGRASSIVCSGTPVRRPWGQVRAPGADTPLWQPSAAVDFELEMVRIADAFERRDAGHQ